MRRRLNAISVSLWRQERDSSLSIASSAVKILNVLLLYCLSVKDGHTSNVEPFYSMGVYSSFGRLRFEL